MIYNAENEQSSEARTLLRKAHFEVAFPHSIAHVILNQKATTDYIRKLFVFIKRVDQIKFAS